MNYWDFQNGMTAIEQTGMKAVNYITEPVKNVFKKKPVMLEEQIRDEAPQELESEEETSDAAYDAKALKDYTKAIRGRNK